MFYVSKIHLNLLILLMILSVTELNSQNGNQYLFDPRGDFNRDCLVDTLKFDFDSTSKLLNLSILWGLDVDSSSCSPLKDSSNFITNFMFPDLQGVSLKLNVQSFSSEKSDLLFSFYGKLILADSTQIDTNYTFVLFSQPNLQSLDTIDLNYYINDTDSILVSRNLKNEANIISQRNINNRFVQRIYPKFEFDLPEDEEDEPVLINSEVFLETDIVVADEQEHISGDYSVQSDVLSSIENFEFQQVFDLQPNPVDNKLIVTSLVEIISVYLVDITGRDITQMVSINCHSLNECEVNIDNLIRGTYFIFIELSNNLSRSKMFVKQ